MSEALVPPAPPSTDATPVEAPSPTRALGDRAARFRALVEENFDFIWRALRGLGVPAESADDAAQHVFLILSRKLDEVAAGSERHFLFGTAVGVAANARRSLARRREVLDEDAVLRATDATPDGERVVELKEQRALLDRVLSEMSDDLRTVFVLFVLEGMASQEIADILGIPAGTVASRLRRAREAFHSTARRLRAQLGAVRRSSR
jgi:RNA polymerase sigma-70 factor (ECF subfamily)